MVQTLIGGSPNIKSAIRRRPRKPWGSYRSTIEERALRAAQAIEQGVSRKRAAATFCVCPTYVDIARSLSAEDRLRLGTGEIKLSHVWRLKQRRFAERRSELAAKQAAERPVQVHSAHGYVDHLVSQHGPEPIVELLRYHLQRRGLSLAEIVGTVCGHDALMTALDAATRPSIAGATKSNGNGHAHA